MVTESIMKTFLLLFLVLGSVVDAIRESDVGFYLFTRDNPDDYVRITDEHVTIEKNSSLVFLIHGWLGSRKSFWYDDAKNALLRRAVNTTVIQVDWSIASQRCYITAVASCEIVGAIIANFILKRNIPVESVRLCGHSLGGQIAGFVGKKLRLRSLILGGVIAWDPAGPLFEEYFIPDSRHLTRHDAKVVLVIHTDPWKAGYFRSCGTIDVYPNGKPINQPGCPGLQIFCSHVRSIELYIDALDRPGTLLATKCPSYEAFKTGECDNEWKIDLGDELEVEDAGEYYLDTRSTKPYGISSGNDV